MCNIQEEIWKDVVGYEGLYQVSNFNGIKDDNRTINLEWCTAQENMIHAFNTGLRVMQKGSERKNSKLTEADVKNIKTLRLQGKTQHQIAQIFNVQRTLIQGILEGKRWKHVLLIFLSIIFLSCSPESKLRRANRLINEATAAGLKWQSDTVFQMIKLIVPETKFDTVVRNVNFRDTIVVIKDKVITRVKVNTVEKQIFVETKCPEKVVIKRVPHTVNREIKVGDTFWTNFKQGLLWLIVGFAACWVLKFFKVIP